MLVLTRRNGPGITIANNLRVHVLNVERPRFGIRSRPSSDGQQRDSEVASAPFGSETQIADPRPMPIESTKIAAKPTILMVDDDPDYCRNMADILGDRGYRVDTAHDGPTALQLVQRQAYDVAMFDLRMPGMDGVTLCSKVVHLRPSIVTLLITGYPEDVVPTVARAAGIRVVLAKPLNVENLLRRIEEATAN